MTDVITCRTTCRGQCIVTALICGICSDAVLHYVSKVGRKKRYALSSLPCPSPISSLENRDVSPGCAAWRHAASGRTSTAELHHQRSNSRAVSPGCKLQVKRRRKVLHSEVYKEVGDKESVMTVSKMSFFT